MHQQPKSNQLMSSPPPKSTCSGGTGQDDISIPTEILSAEEDDDAEGGDAVLEILRELATTKSDSSTIDCSACNNTANHHRDRRNFRSTVEEDSEAKLHEDKNGSSSIPPIATAVANGGILTGLAETAGDEGESQHQNWCAKAQAQRLSSYPTVPSPPPASRLAAKHCEDDLQPKADIDDDTLKVISSIEEYDISTPGGWAIAGPGHCEEEEEENDDEEMVRSASHDDHFMIVATMEAGISARRCSSTASTTREESEDYMVQATLVVEDDLPSEHTNSEHVNHSEHNNNNNQQRPSVCTGQTVVRAAPVNKTHTLGFVVTTLLATVVASLLFGAVLFQQKEPSSDDQSMMNATLSPSPTFKAHPPLLPALERIRRIGIIRCGIGAGLDSSFPEVENVNSQERDQETVAAATAFSNNFFTNLCSAIAAAVTGDATAFEEVVVGLDSSGDEATSGEADLIISRREITMQKDVLEGSIEEGLAYTIPFLYGGIAFVGKPDYVSCVDEDIKTFGNCSDTKICIHESLSFVQVLMDRIPHRQLVISNSTKELLGFFNTGICNVVASKSASLVAKLMRSAGYQGELAVGQHEYSTEMHGISSLDSDQPWANFLNSIMMALLAAEQAGITKETAEQMGETDLFGDNYKNAFINAIEAQGNFAELYDFPIPYTGKNLVNDGTTGLLASPSLGDIGLEQGGYDNVGPVEGGTLEAVRERGLLRCAVRGGRPGFAMRHSSTSTWTGIDISFCKALAASLFDGENEKIQIVDVNQRTEPNGFVLLQDDVVDVFTGALWTLQSSVRETITEEGFSFTQPYFYGPVNDTRYDDNLCMATRQDDPQFSDFVFWTAQSLVYAEEHGIVQRVSSRMPFVDVFGVSLNRMFRDAVHSVGNYAEIYDRHLEHHLPRSGRNRLNLWDGKGRAPMRYIPPGFDVLDN